MRVRNPISKFRVAGFRLAYESVLSAEHRLARLQTAIAWAVYTLVFAGVVAFAEYARKDTLLSAYSVFVAACMNGNWIVVGNDAVECIKI